MNAERKKHEAKLKADDIKAEASRPLVVRISPWRIDWDSREYMDWLAGAARGGGVKR